MAKVLLNSVKTCYQSMGIGLNINIYLEENRIFWTDYYM